MEKETRLGTHVVRGGRARVRRCGPRAHTARRRRLMCRAAPQWSAPSQNRANLRAKTKCHHDAFRNAGCRMQSIHTLLPPKASGLHLCSQTGSQSAFSFVTMASFILLTVKQFPIGCGIWRKKRVSNRLEALCKGWRRCGNTLVRNFLTQTIAALDVLQFCF